MIRRRASLVVAPILFFWFVWLPILGGEKEPPHTDAYREGQLAIEAKEWDKASSLFAKLAGKPGGEADAALYWKAYADWKRGMKKESLDGLRQLQTSYPKSAWVDDAKALEMEIRDGKAAKAAEAATAPASAGADDEELKLYAVDGLMQVEPEKAVPILERLLAGGSSLRIKQRALFVLSQSDSPRAREILLRVARSGQPMTLRTEAVKTLGIAGGRDDLAALADIARDPGAPPEVRAAVVEAYLISDRPDALAQIATSDPDPAIRAKAIEALGAIGALPSLRKLWATEKDPAVLGKLLEAFGVAGDVETLSKAARESTDPRIREKAIQGLGVSADAGATLRKLYGELKDTDDKRHVVEALMVQGEAKVLIEMFRAEKDPGLKRHILQQLSVMNDPEVTRVLMDVLGDKP